MKIRYLTSASVVIEHGGTQVLCDPWLTDGIYYGSWFHYPTLRCTPEEFAGVDYLYISHIHPDHLDVETLKRLPRSLPVLILDYAEKFVSRTIEQLGFTQVREVPHRGVVSLGEDFTVQLFAADNCNPTLCGSFFGCLVPQPYDRTLQIDSLAVFRGGGKTLVNANDCPYELARSVCDDIVRDRGVDFLLVGYSGAGEYPQCFDNLDDATKLKKAAVKRDQFLRQAVQFMEHLHPRQVMPFAGRYTLGGRLASLNPFRGVPEIEEVPAALQPILETNGVSTNMVLLNPGESFDLERGMASAPFTLPDPVARQRYIDEILVKKIFPYEDGFRVDETDWTDLVPRLREAHRRMRSYQDRYGYRSTWTLYLDTGQPDLYRVPFDGGTVERVGRETEREPFVRIRVDYSLLTMLLDRKAHWNNAAIGSHLRFFRKPDEYERGLYHFLSYFHC